MDEHINDREFTARFWSQVHIAGVESQGWQFRCWLWTGATRNIRPGGAPNYGRIKYKTLKLTAHRTAYELFHGKRLPNDVFLLHACDNPLCCNPYHLTEGTRAENRADTVLKNRHAYGERHARSKLTEQDVVEIRRLYKEGGHTYKSLGKDFRVATTTIQGIIERKIWAYLED